MAIWIVYRKGSFWLKERVSDSAHLRLRLARLRREGAVYVSVEKTPSPRLARAFELPPPATGAP